MSCPNPNDLAAFLEGHLEPEQAERLEHHLDECSECRQIIAFGGSLGPRTSPVASSELRPEQAPPSADVPKPSGAGLLAPGDQLDAFVVVRRLGTGGMGEVYLAKDAELGRRVAIKVIREDRIGSPLEAERFVREARVTARLNHPGIVTIYAIGRTHGVPYLALEYVEGETLQERLRAGALGAATAIPIARAVAEAAQEAHRHLIVHGDLKPSNVLLGADGRVRTLDFGLARFVRSDASMVAETTIRSSDQAGSQTGVQGTPSYMAPEQWEAAPATPASDVWAIGVLLFEMIAGHVPFSVAQVARCDARASEACDALRSAGVEVPSVVQDLLVRCLDVEPAKRLSMQQVAEALAVLERMLALPSLRPGQAWGAGVSIDPGSAPEARLASAGSAATSGARRTPVRPGVVVFSVVGVGVLLGVAAFAGWQGMPRGVDAVPALGAAGEHASAAVAPGASAPPLSSGAVGAASSAPVTSAPPVPPRSVPSGSTGTRPPKPPLPSMRLAAIASLEDQAEAADQRARSAKDPGAAASHRAVARQLRGAADKQLNDVERMATQMQSTEPADAASLLDYVRSARAYLRQRRAASGAP
jgi:tRNA A-37 threonylcarbamoyl transferase component Bud32